MKKKKQPTKKSQLKNTVMKKIEDGDVVMKPKSYFVMLSVVTSISAAVILGFSVYLVNLFILRLEVEDGGPRAFGRYFFAMNNFSWPLLIGAILATGLLVYMIRKKFYIGHKIPSWALIFGSILYVIVFGLVISRTSLNQGLYEKPPFRPLYNEQVRDKLESKNMHDQDDDRGERGPRPMGPKKNESFRSPQL